MDNKLTNPPKWFDLKKYTNSDTKEIGQWIMNFKSRIIALHCLENGNDVYGYVLDDILKFRDEGFIIFDNDFPYQHYNQTFVKSMTVNDIVMLNKLISLDTENNIENYASGNGGITEEMDQNITDLGWFKEVDDCYAHININAPIDIIMEDFKKWLIQRKVEFNEKIGIKTKIDITPAKMGEWFNLRIIQYMDLLIWKKQEKISYNTLAEWIFPEEVNSKEPIDLEARVGRTLNKHVSDICKSEFIDYQEIKNAQNFRKKYKQR